MEVLEFVKELDEFGRWECLCGNEAEDDGFYPCDQEGNEVEPDVESGWVNLYICNCCKRIINQDTLQVVGRNPNFELK